MGVMGLFGHNNDPSKEANKYISQIPDKTRPYYQPYIDAGTNQLGINQDEYNKLINDPGSKFNDIGQSFHESPGFKFAMQQALQGSGNAAAAGGMAGSPQHEQQNMQLANDLANQDYYHYMQGATDLYGKGLNGGQHITDQGQSAANSYADTLASTLGAQGQLAYEGNDAKNRQKNQANSDIASSLFYK